MVTKKDSKSQQKNIPLQETARFPAATLAYYGPDDQTATKVVVSIVKSADDQQAIQSQKWFSTGVDVRQDSEIIRHIVEFIRGFDVQRVVMADHIIGCPHEEGIDYPRGEKCPRCPFWANRDRWTGKIID